jgi:hypothetical protein
MTPDRPFAWDAPCLVAQLDCLPFWGRTRAPTVQTGAQQIEGADTGLPAAMNLRTA